MTKAIIASAVVAAALIDPSSAFVPANNNVKASGTALAASADRREILSTMAKTLGGVVAFTAGAEDANALANPALETFKSRKGGGAKHIPGKGMLNNGATFDELMAASNPALESFKGKRGGGAKHIPGKGMLNSNMPWDELC
eukprot:CAMPEP_0185740878 /NCGR_PEP_ID=MMETSP1171-20130828/38657_1 /TAXON_ID=374046 /ORGANISM="Helicotheca tamensis, Strain CCMP826" /LENGTH=141 /DNA_ID=CAMNT_0028412807 /DNA_START=48 /DNA_END=473 /DNA_ORIENTATION=+